MNSTSIKEAAAVGFPREKLFGVWWSGAEPDVRPAEGGAKGYSAAMLQHGAAAPEQGPAGVLLEPGRDLRLFDEEVPRAGAHVTRAFQHARWIDGSTHLWMSRRKRPGRGEGWAGLRFDLLDRG